MCWPDETGVLGVLGTEEDYLWFIDDGHSQIKNKYHIMKSLCCAMSSERLQIIVIFPADSRNKTMNFQVTSHSDSL